VEGILTPLSLLMPAFSLVTAPPKFTLRLHCRHDAPLPLHTKYETRGFGGVFSPVTLSAQDHSTSELLRTLSRMAASKPTSWLSGQSHIVCHLTHT
jgi:hypothetical protein